ncbi:MAG: hypothetical protein AAB011_05560 [Candidatus Eisenbacteria bacterium]
MAPTEGNRDLAALEDTLRAEIRAAAKEVQMNAWRDGARRSQLIADEFRSLRQQISDLKQAVLDAPRPSPTKRRRPRTA